MKRGQCGQVLIILVAALLLGGGGLAAGVFLTGKPVGELRKDTLAMIDDKERRSKIEAVFESWKKEVEAIQKRRDQNRKAVFALFQRHDATPADFDRVYAESDAIELQGLGAALDMRFALREQLSADEWRRLFAPPSTKQ